MWTCRICAACSEDSVEVCPGCGAVNIEVSAADEVRPAASGPAPAADETPTEFDCPPLPDPGPAAVECFIGILPEEANLVAEHLREAGIPVEVSRHDSEEGPVHRVRVPIRELSRALAVIDRIHKRREARS